MIGNFEIHRRMLQRSGRCVFLLRRNGLVDRELIKEHIIKTAGEIAWELANTAINAGMTSPTVEAAKNSAMKRKVILILKITRHVDASYEEAIEFVEKNAVKIPMNILGN